LGNAAYKILSNIILEKMKPYIEEVMGDYQNGFRDGRSVTENIFALRIINEKFWEYNQSVQYLLIDFQKAYDSTHRDALWKCMKELKIPTKLINMCKTCVQKTRSAVRIDGTLSSSFENKTGLKQGDPLLPISFNLELQKVIQSIKMVPSGVKIGKKQLNILAYADDIALIGKNEIEIRKLFVGMENIARKFGLRINQEKTKYMIVERKNNLKKNKIGNLKIKNYKFERVENFKYLRVLFNEDNNNQRDLQERIKNANKTYFMLQEFFKNKNIPKKLKLRLKNTIIDKVLTYTSETWTLTTRDRKAIEHF